MAEPNYSFRAALHGFNRTDVINYLSELTAAHAKQLEEKDAELLAAQEETARVKQELMCLRMLIGSEPEESEEPEPETEAEPEAAPQPEPEQLPEPDADVPVVEQELEAYRRAERCEREARARAGKIYGEACDVVEKAKTQLAEQESQLTEMNDALSGDISALQAVMEQIRGHLTQTQAQMRDMEQSIRKVDE